MPKSSLTGTSAAGYTLGSIGIDFVTLGSTSTEDPSTVGSQLTVTLHAELRDIVNAHLELPGDELCTLSNPATFTYSGLNTFVAPETCPTLDPGRPYFVVVSRSAFNGGIATLKVTTSSDEDSGGAAGWSIQRSPRTGSIPMVTGLPTALCGAPSAPSPT